MVLDRLSPGERVAFVLHDSFGFDFTTIAAVLDSTPAAARKLASRARAKVVQPAPEDALADWEVVDAFLAAARGGDVDRLLRLLAPDVVVTGDASAVAMGTPERISGQQDVAQFFDGAARAALAAFVEQRPGAAWVDRGDVRVAFDFTVVHGTVAGIVFRADPAVLAGVRLRRGDEPVVPGRTRLTGVPRAAGQPAERSANALFVARYHPIDRTGWRQRAFISSSAGSCAASPPRTASRRWRSCSLMTSSAVFPRSSTSHGPPSWRQVMAFMIFSSCPDRGRRDDVPGPGDVTA
ncbi:MAG TPA: sigma factor-like helix-turn-helix DNA-binding protein [Mycobacteriales bacterium]|nr:sigma factor-like helix-turn-helix DNA-binding protein [Mycobacteriales bacterium]